MFRGANGAVVSVRRTCRYPYLLEKYIIIIFFYALRISQETRNVYDTAF